MNREDNIESLIRFTLLNIRNLHIRIDWANAFIKFRGTDKYTLNKVVDRLKAGVTDIVNLHPDPEVRKTIVRDLDDKSNDMISTVAFIDAALRIPPEDLDIIADIITEYLENKYPEDDTKKEM